MLSVMERMEVVDEAESMASDRRFGDLVQFLENIPPNVIRSDPTLGYLLAYGSYMIGREAQAQRQLEQLSESVRDANDRLGRRILNLRAIIAIELGNLSNACRLLARVQTLSEVASDHRYVAYSTLNRGIVLDVMGYPVQAIAALQRARLSFQRLGDLAAVAGCAHNLGMCFRRIQCFDIAESEFAAASEHFSKNGSKEEFTATLLERALTLSMAGEADVGWDNAMRARADASHLRNERLEVEALRVLGSISAQRGEYSQAKLLFRGALDKGATLGLKLLQAEILVELARIANIEGKQEDSSDMLAGAAELFTEMGAPKRAHDVQRF